MWKAKLSKFGFHFIFWGILISQPLSAQVNVQKMDELLPAILDSAKIPGISIAVIDQGKMVYSSAFGRKELRKESEISKQTIFEAASLTKPITAFCAMKLVEMGKLDLDKPLYQYLEYPDAASDQRYQLITGRMVLSHKTGFPNWRKNRNSNKLEIKFDPDTKFGYSGEGFVYLQKVMEQIERKSLELIAQEFVFQPLQMHRSFLIFPETDDFAVGHNPKNEPNQKFMPKEANAAYSLHTTAEDYSKFLLELMYPSLIDSAFVSDMISQETLMDSKDPSLGWGLGLGINTTSLDQYIWHWGDNGTFRAFFIFSPKTEVGLVYFTNSQNGLSIVKRMVHLTFSDPEVMENWNEYKQFDDE
ncbi:beta-lactamase family protein [Algoriphagus lutimaris]|uniref:serine hydrolase domain-containing protein n=1 Tax=Algoriphagus lutimaris TaxID=613197 RepID=UPI00196A3CDB|nr:serine hydrolase domain-containing protein [Algoriphagus lutimaris]MBN3521088.1 beta-lactamase family protein [Algoriphagus lutimaris]